MVDLFGTMFVGLFFIICAQISELQAVKEWFGPSPDTGYCYYVHDDAGYLFDPAKAICAGLDAMLPQLPSSNPADELAYWIGKADGVLNIDINYGWSSGFWLGYIDDDNPNGHWVSIYDQHVLPYDEWAVTSVGSEKYHNANNNLAFVSKYAAWKLGSYTPEYAEFLVCQRNGCDTGPVTGGAISKTGINEYTLSCDVGYQLVGASVAGCQCPNTLNLGSCEKQCYDEP